MDVRLADFYAPRIKDALDSLVSTDQIKGAISAAGGDPDRAKALIAALPVDTTALSAVLADLAADSFIAGLLASYLQLLMVLHSESLTKGALLKAEQIPSWDNWEPGDVTASNVVVQGGLADILDAQGIAIQNITGTALTNLGNVVGVSMASGEPVDELAGNLGKYGYTSTERAGIIAHTETMRAASAATFEAYDVNGVEKWTLVLSDGACDECIAAQQGGPYPISDQDDAPPVHPWCRCSSVPVVAASKLKGAAENLAIGEAVEEGIDGEEDGLISKLRGDLEGYLHGHVLGDLTTDIQGRRLALAVGRAQPGEGEAIDLSAATSSELVQAAGAAPGSTEVGQNATEQLMEELDTRDEDAAQAAGWQAALSWDGKGAPPANPDAGTDLADVWQQAFDEARRDPELAANNLLDYQNNQLEG